MCVTVNLSCLKHQIGLQQAKSMCTLCTVLHVTQREKRVSCSILIHSFIHHASDIAVCVEKWATSARCIPHEIW